MSVQQHYPFTVSSKVDYLIIVNQEIRKTVDIISIYPIPFTLQNKSVLHLPIHSSKIYLTYVLVTEELTIKKHGLFHQEIVLLLFSAMGSGLQSTEEVIWCSSQKSTGKPAFPIVLPRFIHRLRSSSCCLPVYTLGGTGDRSSTQVPALTWKTQVELRVPGFILDWSWLRSERLRDKFKMSALTRSLLLLPLPSPSLQPFLPPLFLYSPIFLKGTYRTLAQTAHILILE